MDRGEGKAGVEFGLSTALDYGLQKWGPGGKEMEEELRAIDEVCEELIGFFEERGVEVWCCQSTEFRR